MAKTDEEKEQTWEDHLAAAIKAFRKEMQESRGDWFPEEFKTHRRAAQREMLLAWRSLLDARIEKLEKADAAREKSVPKAARIKVE
jgi:hypothetical protein